MGSLNKNIKLFKGIMVFFWVMRWHPLLAIRTVQREWWVYKSLHGGQLSTGELLTIGYFLSIPTFAGESNEAYQSRLLEVIQ